MNPSTNATTNLTLCLNKFLKNLKRKHQIEPLHLFYLLVLSVPSCSGKEREGPSTVFSTQFMLDNCLWDESQGLINPSQGLSDALSLAKLGRVT